MPHRSGHSAPAQRANPIDAMTQLMRSGEMRKVQKGEEFDHPYYKQSHQGVPRGYTDDQQIEFSKLAQSLTYADTEAWDRAHSPTFRYRPPTYAGGSGGFKSMGSGPGGAAIAQDRNKGPNDQLSSQDLYDFLKAFGKKSKDPVYGKGRSGDFLGRAMLGDKRPADRKEYGDPIEMVRSGANLAAAAGFGEGRTGYSKYVDPFEGVDIRRFPDIKPFEPRSTTGAAGATNPGLRVAEMTPLPGSAEEDLRTGKTGAGRAYRRRSRSASMTEQPTAGRLLGSQQGSQVLG